MSIEVYLNADRPRWAPRGESELRDVVEQGLISESHYIDVKRVVGDKPGERKETARDLASFAIDGGALLIGVDEDKATRTFSLAPQPLEGLMERLEQVAAFLIDPPLTIVPEEIPSDADPSVGYLLVHVPPSPSAPHMVGGQYHGRGERTRRQLDDAEIVRLHTKRTSQEGVGDRLLDVEIAREPVPAGSRRVGHMYLVAQPINAPRGLARDFVRGPDKSRIYDLVRNRSVDFKVNGIVDIAPTPRGYADSQSVRANGYALHSYALSGPGRTLAPSHTEIPDDNGTLLDVEIRDDGGIRILVGRMTDQVGRRPGQEDEMMILDGLAVAYSRRLVDWAAALGEATGWRGSWTLGLHGDRLRGLKSYVTREGMFLSDGPAYDVDSYREVTTASHVEMLQRPGTVARRLVGRLADGLNTFNRFSGDLTDVVVPEPAEPPPA